MINIKINKKQFGDLVIFDNTEINIHEGSFIGIKGLSGSGKTTLLSIIGLLEDFEGEYYLNDILINKKNKENIRIKYMSYVFQKPYLIPYLDVYDNVCLPLKNSKQKINQDEIKTILDKMNIAHLFDKMPIVISGGEAQRVNIARAYASRRNIMLIDEPTGSLDPENAKIVMDLFKKINEEEKITMIIVTHSNDFDDYFTEIYNLNNKRINKNEII